MMSKVTYLLCLGVSYLVAGDRHLGPLPKPLPLPGPLPPLGGYDYAPPPPPLPLPSVRPIPVDVSGRPPRPILHAQPVLVDDNALHVPANYNFDYAVDDGVSGANFGHSESRQGPITQGEYFVNLPDGRLQRVQYYADETGYHATVTYEGEAVHPQLPVVPRPLPPPGYAPPVPVVPTPVGPRPIGPRPIVPNPILPNPTILNPVVPNPIAPDQLILNPLAPRPIPNHLHPQEFALF